MAEQGQPRRRRRQMASGGCRNVGQRIGAIVGAVILLVICGAVGLLTLRVGPEVLVALACLLLCIGAPILLVAGWVVWQRSQNEDE